jgi:hypothetical protein
MNFDQKMLRLKQCLNVTTDKDVAEVLGMSKSALAERKRREAFPERVVRALAQERPELGIDVLYVLTGERDYLLAETQDQFISRMQSINATARIVGALPLPEREREGLKLCLTGEPEQDARAIAEALHGASLAQGSKSEVTEARGTGQIQVGPGTVVPMPTNENVGVTQQEVLTLVLDALHKAKRTLPAARIFAVVDAVMAWQRAGMNVTESSVVDQLRQVK